LQLQQPTVVAPKIGWVWVAKRSFADDRADGQVAPIPAVRVLMNGRLATPSSHHEKGRSRSASMSFDPIKIEACYVITSDSIWGK